MSDLIKKHDVIEALNAVDVYGDGVGFEVLSHAIRDVSLLPIVEAEPVRHGKWDYVTVAEEGYWKCSCCNFPTEAFGAKRLYKYCPNCGAKMGDTNHDKTD